jgi:hypothetical protein
VSSIGIEVSRVRRSTPESLTAEQSALEVFLSVPLSKIDLRSANGWNEKVWRILAPDRQRDLGTGVTFNSGI